MGSLRDTFVAWLERLRSSAEPGRCMGVWCLEIPFRSKKEPIPVPERDRHVLNGRGSSRSDEPVHTRRLFKERLLTFRSETRLR